MPVMRVLVVCTANICRSPVMEAVLREGIGGRPGLGNDEVIVSSIGIAGHEGASADPLMIEVADQAGIDVSGSVGTAFSLKALAEADLILAATRSHRSAIVRRDPHARNRCFTFREFARYCRAAPAQEGGSDAKRLAGLIEFAQEHRGSLHPERASDDDVADPHGRRRGVYRKAIQTIVAAADDILAAASQGARSAQPKRSRSSQWRTWGKTGSSAKDT